MKFVTFLCRHRDGVSGDVERRFWDISLCPIDWRSTTQQGRAISLFCKLIHDLLFLPISTIESRVS